jgi:hypothetical protein
MREALLILLLVLLVLDWRQTLVIARPGGWVEGWNPILRRLIARYRYAGVHGYFAAVIALTLALAWLLWQLAPLLAYFIGGSVLAWECIPIAALAVLQALPVAHNYSLGIKP